MLRKRLREMQVVLDSDRGGRRPCICSGMASAPRRAHRPPDPRRSSVHHELFGNPVDRACRSSIISPSLGYSCCNSRHLARSEEVSCCNGSTCHHPDCLHRRPRFRPGVRRSIQAGGGVTGAHSFPHHPRHIASILIIIFTNRNMPPRTAAVRPPQIPWHPPA